MKNVLRLGTWNIKQGQYLPILLKTIKQQRDFASLDVLAIQESFVHQGINDAERIAQALGSHHDYFQVNVRLPFNKLQGNAIIWDTRQLTITKRESFFLPDSYGKHLPAWEKMVFRFSPKQDRNCIVLEGRLQKKSLRLYATHLDVFGFTHKRAQFNAILEDSYKRPPVDLTCIMGDFNTFKFASRPTWKNLAEDTKASGFHDLTSEINWTFTRRGIKLKQKLDAIFIKPYSLPYHSWSLDVHGSDHIPVFSEINISHSGANEV